MAEPSEQSNTTSEKFEPFRAPKGTHDVFPPESARWEALIATFAEIVERAGYGLIQGPMFEEIGVFRRLGEGTEVVRKEMYEFHDKSDPPHHLALRPEGTATVARAFIEHRPTPPWKVWYAAPNFRYENTQAGRYRQHHQVGLEVIGSADPDLDVEVIALLHDFFATLGLRRVELVVNSIGTPSDRRTYVDRLRAYLNERVLDLDLDDQEKVQDHPMRVLDTKRPKSLGVIADAPLLLDNLSSDAQAHFDRVIRGLSALDISHEIDPRLVRGLDYYTHTAFEFRSAALDSAQNAIGGGGRYDGLVEALGGPSTPGIGFGSGIERVLLACDHEGVFGAPDRSVDVYVTDLTGGHHARDLTFQLRRAGISADRGFDQRSMKSQMKSADRSGARFVAMVGEDEVARNIVTLRALRGEVVPGVAREQESVDRSNLVDHVKNLLHGTRGVSK